MYSRLMTIIIVMFFIKCVIVRSQCDIDGYYWKDYTGKIPPDALPGGIDIYGNPIYIGQIFNAKYLIPAKLYINDRRAYYEYGGSEHEITTNIKVFCTQHPEQFEWVKTNNTDVEAITDKRLIIGGFEPGTTTYIGRAQEGNELSVGKVITNTFSFFVGLHVTTEGKGKRRTSFEVLTYNPSAKKPYNESAVSSDSSQNSCRSKLYHIEVYT